MGIRRSSVSFRLLEWLLSGFGKWRRPSTKITCAYAGKENKKRFGKNLGWTDWFDGTEHTMGWISWLDR